MKIYNLQIFYHAADLKCFFNELVGNLLSCESKLSHFYKHFRLSEHIFGFILKMFS